MARPKSKEEQQMSVNEKRALRKKQMAQLKASNEMLEAAKQTIMDHYGKDSEQTETLFKQIDAAKDENLERASSYLGASQDEVESTAYNKVSKLEAEKYYARLKKLGKKEEDLYKKSIDIVEPEVPSGGNGKINSLMSKLDKLKNLKGRKKTEAKSVTAETVAEEPVREEIPEEDTGFFNDVVGTEDDTDKASEPEKKNGIKELKGIDDVISDDKLPKKPNLGDFDPRSVPDYVQYDIIPLPSKGECYPHKKGCLPVAYLTTSDENIIASPNIYNNGKLIDILLERKVLDKSIRVSDLTKGDRDAIIVWLRATAYGPEYPIIATYNDQEFKTDVDLSKLKYNEFNLKGDENGYFDYKTKNGDIIKFKFLTADEENDIFESNNRKYQMINTHDIIELCSKILVDINNIDNDDKETIADTVKEIQRWASELNEESNDIDSNAVYNTAVTSRMCAYTMSVNGNSDRAFVKNYIENMRSIDAREYREYVNSNTPSMNFNVTIDVPESLGGGSFTTFLRLGETIFFNVK